MSEKKRAASREPHTHHDKATNHKAIQATRWLVCSGLNIHATSLRTLNRIGRATLGSLPSWKDRRDTIWTNGSRLNDGKGQAQRRYRCKECQYIGPQSNLNGLIYGTQALPDPPPHPAGAGDRTATRFARASFPTYSYSYTSTTHSVCQPHSASPLLPPMAL